MILVIQNGYLTPCIQEYLNEECHIIKSFESNVSNISLDIYSIIIILGGYQSVIDLASYPYLVNVINLIIKCLEINKPILGICLGCQLIARALGCEIRSTGKLNIGYDTKIMSCEKIFRSHIDYIIPNDLIEVLEYFEEIPYLYKHKNHVYGIQCHPDMGPLCVKKYVSDDNIQKFAEVHRDEINENNRIIIDKILGELLSEK